MQEAHVAAQPEQGSRTLDSQSDDDVDDVDIEAMDGAGDDMFETSSERCCSLRRDPGAILV